MKKTLTILGLMIASAVWAEGDSYLYWMVGDTTGYADYDTVKIKATDGTSGSSSYLTLGWNDSGEFTAFSPAGSLVADDAYLQGMQSAGVGFYASLASLSGNNFSYVIELYKSDMFLAQSDILSSADSLQYIVNVNTELKSMMTAWSPTAYAVPEPNSALLMALGFAALALRRRKSRKV